MQVLPAEMSLEDTALFYARAAAGAHDASIAAYKVRFPQAVRLPSLAGCSLLTYRGPPCCQQLLQVAAKGFSSKS